MLAGDHELTALHDPLAPLGQLAEEQDVALLQLAAGGHVLPLGPMAVKVHQAPGGVEELEEEGIIHVVLVVLGVFLIVLQILFIDPIIVGLEVQAQAAEGGIDPFLHIAHALHPGQLLHEGVG